MTDLLQAFEYILPPELIAHEPALKRDESRLFIYDTKTDTISFDVFRNIANYLPKHALMVLNESKVLPAQLSVITEAGKEIELLCLVNEVNAPKGTFFALSKTKLQSGHKLALRSHILTVLSKVRGKYVVALDNGSLEELVTTYGTTPTPPYIHTRLSESEARERYQTVFATNGSSVAAPTASLHFTDAVFESLNEKHVERTYVNLDVGLGTFAKVTDEQIERNELHEEPFSISAKSANAIKTAKESGRPVIAVGTTVVRTLESVSELILKGHFTDLGIQTTTKLFIQPGFEFKLTDQLITNFHVPRSSLMMLVEAFLVHKGSKRRILDLYRRAIEEKFRFYSFGDSMVIL